MPKYGPLYRAKRPLLQMKILRSIALNGILSQKEAATKFRCKSSTISEAFKIMTKKTMLIETTKHPDLERRLKREKFSKLSA
jgi:DNA-binding MarR family transcriptional regulator